MSRSLAFAATLCLAFIALAAPAQAQSTDTPAAESTSPPRVEGPITVPTGGLNVMITGERRRPCLGTDANGQIVVCGRDNGEDVRVPDDENRTDDGLPRAPSVGMESCKGKGQKGCIGFGGVPPPVFYIDLKSIPEAPKGSDAEKVAKGEMSDR